MDRRSLLTHLFDNFHNFIAIMNQSIKHNLAFALAMACSMLAVAATPLPTHFTGTWSTTESEYAEGIKKTDLYMSENGSGILVGFVTPHLNVRSPRQFFAMPIQGALEGDVLVTRPSMVDAVHSAELALKMLRCRYDSSGPTLNCTDPNGVVVTMPRHSENMTAELTEAITVLRAQPPNKYLQSLPPMPTSK